MNYKYPDSTDSTNTYADDSTGRYYSSKASDLAEKYSRAGDLFSGFFEKYLSPGSSILDIGCGSGRDMANLAKYGFTVTGTDSSAEMLEAAKRKYPELQEKVIQSSLPDLSAIKNNYKGILCSAVFQHIQNPDLYESFRRIRELTSESGIFIVSFPVKYPGIDPKTNRDKKGRLFYLRPLEKYRFLIERLGFSLLESISEKDSLGREGIIWTTFVYRKEASNRLKPLNIIDSILREDKKTTTYKFALLRALSDTASYSYNSATWLSNGKVAVKIDLIAKKWLGYYWPIITNSQFIIQGQDNNKEGKSDLSFREDLINLANNFNIGNSLVEYLSASNKNILTDDEKIMENKVLKSIKNTIIKGPIKYSGSDKTGGKIFSYNNGNLIMPSDLWQEFALMGRWIEDSIILRWADFSAERPYNKANNIKLSTILDLLLTSIEAKRDVSIVRNILKSYTSLECVWSGRPLKKYDIDHALPFSIWRNNDIWNLFPADSTLNNSKRDKLPSIKIINSSRKRIFNYWDMYYEKASSLFLYQAGNFCGTIFSDLGKDTRNYLFSAFSETIEIVAEQRGSERWDG